VPQDNQNQERTLETLDYLSHLVA
ncbi:MAG: hypothetical protein RLZZ203_1174, partial [Cyanobacteriota bacterium]